MSANEDEQTLAWAETYSSVIRAGGAIAAAATLADNCVNDYKANPDMDHFFCWYRAYAAQCGSYVYPVASLPVVRAAALAAGNQAIVDYENIFIVNHNRRSS